VDYTYWWSGGLTMAMAIGGGRDGPAWFDALHRSLHNAQSVEGHTHGSFERVGLWGNEGGRALSTALGSLALISMMRAGRGR
jgi:hypothetical protein